MSYVTGASNIYWLTVWWAGPASHVAGKVRGNEGIFLFLLFFFLFFFCFFFFFVVVVFFFHFHSFSSFFPVPLISFTISSIPFLPHSGRRHKMTHKG